VVETRLEERPPFPAFAIAHTPDGNGIKGKGVGQLGVRGTVIAHQPEAIHVREQKVLVPKAKGADLVLGEKCFPAGFLRLNKVLVRHLSEEIEVGRVLGLRLIVHQVPLAGDEGAREGDGLRNLVAPAQIHPRCFGEFRRQLLVPNVEQVDHVGPHDLSASTPSSRNAPVKNLCRRASSFSASSAGVREPCARGSG